MNNWNYTEYIPVVHHDLTNNSTMTYTTSGQDYVFFPILTVRTMSVTNWGIYFVQLAIRRVWRYQRGIKIPYIEEEQTTQWPKEKVQKDKQRSTKHTYKAKDRVTRTPLTRGSQEPVIAHLVFNLTSKVDRKWGCYT